MKLKDIYSLNINREINPAVVVSNRKEATVRAEIEEYVFTDDILEKLYEILNTVLNKKKGKTGIWINGYYGSGKSHFIKFVHYCLNPDTAESAFGHFIDAARKYDTTAAGKKEEITENNITLLKKKVMAIHCDHIMFNVEDETDDSKGERLTRIFLSMFNKFRGYNANDLPTALLLEKYLDERGKLEEFVGLVSNELSHDWKSDAADIVSYELGKVLEIAKRLAPELDIVALHAKLSNPETYRITINSTLIPEFKDFLKDKPSDYRLLFLVDEVSQYVGGNKEILLNFQNIIERVSEDCNNQIWIACTAQQTLEEVSSATGTTDVQDEFGKILGRFDTRISLESNDAAYITQKRVLDKNAIGLQELGKIYKRNKDAIEIQFKMRHDLYKGFKSEDDFYLSYPFVPYQFKLIADVFQQFQNLNYVIKEVKNNERSVLGITHFTARKWSDEEVGKFIPFDAFFNEQFSTNLTQRGRRAIENALSLPYVKENEFAKRVVKTLFMTSNLPDATRMTFPSNIENLTILMMEDVDVNKLALQNHIKEVVQRLLDESIIREEKSAYFFFNEDEMDVQMLIKNTAVGLPEKVDFFDALFRPVFNVPQKTTFGSNDFTIRYQVDDKVNFRKGDFGLLFQLYDNRPPEKMALENSAHDLVVCFSEWFFNDPVRKDFESYCQTLKYFSTSGYEASGTRAKTVESFKIRNEELKKQIIAKVSDKSLSTRFISGQEVLDSSEVSGTQPAERLKNLIEKHLEKIYKHHKLSGSYAKNAMELRASAASTQTVMPELTQAEEMINAYITQHGNELNAEDIINNFSKVPFGWRDEATLDMLVQLVKKKKRNFKYRGEPRYGIVDFVNKAVNKPERVVCVVTSGEAIEQATIDRTIKRFRETFNIDLPETTDGGELQQYIFLKLDALLEEYGTYEEKYYGPYPFGATFHELNKKLSAFRDKRDPRQLFQFLEESHEMKAVFDKAKGVKDFVSRAIKEYDAIQSFYTDNRSNFSSLSVAGQELAGKLADFLQSEEPQHELRHVSKGYSELKQELNSYVKKLRDDLSDSYSQAFDRLDQEAAKRKVTEAHVYAFRDHVLSQLSKLNSIQDLELKKSEIKDWESEQLRAIIQFSAEKGVKQGQMVAEPQTFYVKRSCVINNTEELETYLKQTREEMEQILKSGKVVIIK